MGNANVREFLNSIGLKHLSMATIIKRYNLWKSKYGCYERLTQINAHNTNASISQADTLKIYKCIYDYWYDYLQELGFARFTVEQKNKIKAFLAMDKYRKENMSPADCYNFVHHEYDTVLKNCGIRPIKSQDENAPILSDDGGVCADFVHCKPFEAASDISCRLYLNVKPENISALTECLLKKCYDKHYRVYFKFWTDDSRNDTFLIYTNYDMVAKFVEVLREIRRENPKIFEGCENINPLMINIDNFIGFGEEPKYKHSSFNSERADAIDAFNKDVIEKKIVEERKYIGNYQGTINTSRGDVLSIEEYLVYRLEQSLHETILQHQRDIMNRQYPSCYIRWGSKAISSYIEMENKIYRTCMNGLPAFVKAQIREQARAYLEGLKNGKDVRIRPITFPTNNLDLFSPVKRSNCKDELNKEGKLDYQFFININMQEKLFDVFGSELRIESVITDESVVPFLANQHVSSMCPSLNTETESVLAEDGYRI